MIFLVATAVRDVSNHTGAEPHGHTRSDLGSLSVCSRLELIYLENMVACENRAIFFILLREHPFVSESLYIMFEASTKCRGQKVGRELIFLWGADLPTSQ